MFKSHILNKHHVRRKNTVDKVVMGTVQTLKKQEKNTTRKYNNSKRHPMDVQIRFNNISGVVYNTSEENIAILYVHSDFVVVTALYSFLVYAIVNIYTNTSKHVIRTTILLQCTFILNNQRSLIRSYGIEFVDNRCLACLCVLVSVCLNFVEII